MGAEFEVDNLEDMCRAMCDNTLPERESEEKEQKKGPKTLLENVAEWNRAIEKRGYVE